LISIRLHIKSTIDTRNAYIFGLFFFIPIFFKMSSILRDEFLKKVPPQNDIFLFFLLERKKLLVIYKAVSVCVV